MGDEEENQGDQADGRRAERANSGSGPVEGAEPIAMTLESVTEQYVKTVRPMHEEFVEPSKRHADVIIPEGGYNEIAIDMLTSKIRLMQEVYG